ncbi:MAG: DUF4233 domain-containing protein [Streptosporangiales bacterium]|nr:DUF4233 domain-containing protein [Streptosporangiales bacterium]
MSEPVGQRVRRPLIDVNKVTRRFCTILLVFEAVVGVLATSVGAYLQGYSPLRAWVVGGTFALLALVLCGFLRHTWAYVVGSVLQLVAIAAGFLVSAMFVLGVIFAGLWVAALWCGRIAHPHER